MLQVLRLEKLRDAQTESETSATWVLALSNFSKLLMFLWKGCFADWTDRFIVVFLGLRFIVGFAPCSLLCCCCGYYCWCCCDNQAHILDTWPTNVSFSFSVLTAYCTLGTPGFFVGNMQKNHTLTSWLQCNSSLFHRSCRYISTHWLFNGIFSSSSHRNPTRNSLSNIANTAISPSSTTQCLRFI